MDPLENESGSTLAWWFVVLDAAQVACVTGSEAICSGRAAAPAAADMPTIAASATTNVACRGDGGIARSRTFRFSVRTDATHDETRAGVKDDIRRFARRYEKSYQIMQAVEVRVPRCSARERRICILRRVPRSRASASAAI